MLDAAAPVKEMALETAATHGLQAVHPSGAREQQKGGEGQKGNYIILYTSSLFMFKCCSCFAETDVL